MHKTVLRPPMRCTKIEKTMIGRMHAMDRKKASRNNGNRQRAIRFILESHSLRIQRILKEGWR